MQHTTNTELKLSNVTLGHGSGGKMMRDLIKKVTKDMDNPILSQFGDSALINNNGFKIAFTTDSYVVNPPFFNGGDIGKLAVCGTVNDLAVSGATPQYISLSLIIEEGFSLKELEKISKSISHEAIKTRVKIVTGDRKVVEK